MFIHHEHPMYIVIFKLSQVRISQGKEFNNEFVNKICDILKTKHRTTSAYHPHCNGLTGTFNRYLRL